MFTICRLSPVGESGNIVNIRQPPCPAIAGRIDLPWWNPTTIYLLGTRKICIDGDRDVCVLWQLKPLSLPRRDSLLGYGVSPHGGIAASRIAAPRTLRITQDTCVFSGQSS